MTTENTFIFLDVIVIIPTRQQISIAPNETSQPFLPSRFFPVVKRNPQIS